MDLGLKDITVNAGCLLFFEGITNARDKSDVLDCTLYVQLAASKKHHKFNAFDDWRDTWLAASLRFGWHLSDSESINQSAMSWPSDATVWDWIKHALPQFINASDVSQGEVIARQRYHQNPDQPAVSLLSEQVLQRSETESGLTTVALQLGFVGPMSTLSLVQLNFTSRQPLKADFLFQPMVPNDVVGNVGLTFYSMQLVDRAYAQFRGHFNAALTQRRPALVCPLKGIDDV